MRCGCQVRSGHQRVLIGSRKPHRGWGTGAHRAQGDAGSSRAVCSPEFQLQEAKPRGGVLGCRPAPSFSAAGLAQQCPETDLPLLCPPASLHPASSLRPLSGVQLQGNLVVPESGLPCGPLPAALGPPGPAECVRLPPLSPQTFPLLMNSLL